MVAQVTFSQVGSPPEGRPDQNRSIPCNVIEWTQFVFRVEYGGLADQGPRHIVIHEDDYLQGSDTPDFKPGKCRDMGGKGKIKLPTLVLIRFTNI